jgi:hypothetical protein
VSELIELFSVYKKIARQMNTALSKLKNVGSKCLLPLWEKVPDRADEGFSYSTFLILFDNNF